MTRSLYLWLILCSTFVLSQALAQEEQEVSLRKNDVPKPILESFQKAYPKAMITGYSKETDKGVTSYEIESREGSVHRDVQYAPDGTLIVVEESMPYNKLPRAVRNAVTKEYPKGKVTYCEKLSKTESTQYEVALKSGKQKYEVVFNSDGSIAETEKK
ncbi:MAG TPA: PepSY-like domain-containing protein [Bacteroidota bacterium]|jgi:hypothetical protein|nr:PepSY-like domain-containing protein [Bacteroidota bacterium]